MAPSRNRGPSRSSRRLTWKGSATLLALFAVLVTLAALPARRATAAFPPAFAAFEDSTLIADNLTPNPNGGVGAVLRVDEDTCNVLQTLSDPAGVVFTSQFISDLRVD